MKLKRALSIAICLLIFMSSCIITTSAAQQQGYINDTGVRLRSAATTASAQVYKFTVLNTKVNVLETVSGQEAEEGNGTTWYKVSTLDGAYTGYVYGAYLTLIPLENVTPNPDFETQLAQFPESYHASLRALHENHPAWIFEANNVSYTLDEAVYAQYKDARKMVELSQGIAWRSLQEDYYDWETDDWRILDSGRWVAASREVIAHYMDPRNFLNEASIYMFMAQGYDSAYQNEAALSNILKGTFLENNYTPNTADPVDSLYGGSYSKVIMAAAEKSGVSPYVIAATIIVEQGSGGTSSLISGTYPGFEGYYNFFNVGAYSTSDGGTSTTNGLSRAKSEGWDSRADSIFGGAMTLANGYISVGQDTYYYTDFNVLNPDRLWHQYAGSVYDANVKAKRIAANDNAGTYANAPMVFKIPVFASMPDTPQALPAVGDARYNNYYIKDMQVDGLSPSFNMYVYTYNLSISGDTTVYLTLPEGATLASNTANWISSGYNSIKLTVKSQTGYLDSYTLNVQSPVNCTLTVTTDPPPSTEPDPPVEPDPPAPQYIKGDTNGDGKISILDLANVQKHLLGILELKDENALGADTNSDGKISILDLANIQKHLLGIIVLI